MESPPRRTKRSRLPCLRASAASSGRASVKRKGAACGGLVHFQKGADVRCRLHLLLATVLVVGSLSLHAQAPVVGASDPDALFHSSDPKLNANKQAAYHIVRDLLEAGHWELADKSLTERYIQHNRH